MIPTRVTNALIFRVRDILHVNVDNSCFMGMPVTAFCAKQIARGEKFLTFNLKKMNDQILFEDGNVLITSTKLVYGGNYYPLGSIKSVVYFKLSLDISGLLMNAVFFLAGIYGIFTFSTVGLILGLIAVIVCGFNLKNFYAEIQNPTYIVAVDFHSGESISIKTGGKNSAKKLHDVLHLAIQMN